MCGIVGRICFDSHVNSEMYENVKHMMNAQVHRGPNDSGLCGFTFREKKVVDLSSTPQLPEAINGLIGFNRLSIQDLSQNGHQPMMSDDALVVLAFNGEIYNAHAFKKELIQKGYVFKGNSDTEVLLYLYLEYGLKETLSKINGMYAIALLDLRINKFFLVRDRFGIKPMYYYLAEKILIFASEVKSIIQNTDVKRELNMNALNEYFTFKSTYNKCLLKNVNLLYPGEILVCSFPFEVKKERFFDVNQYHRENCNKMSKSEWTYLTHTKIQECVARQMISDVKVGCQLSGGVDSSMVSYFAKKTAGNSLNDSVSIVFDDSRYSEKPYIDYVANYLKIKSHHFTLTSDYILNNIERAIWHLDTIAAHPNALGILLLTEKAKEHVTVLLSGEGADELYGGYGPFYAGYYVRNYLKIRNALTSSCLPIWYDDKFFKGQTPNFASYVIMSNTSIDKNTINNVLPDYNQESILEERFSLYNELEGSDFDKQIKYAAKTYLPELLLRQDKMSMANSIENRVPLLDNESAELAFSIPEKYLIHKTVPTNLCMHPSNFVTGKYILKKVCANQFSRSFAFREKSGFPLPIRKYMEEKNFNEYLRDVLFVSLKDRGIFNAKTIKYWIENVNIINDTQIDALWRVINSEIWCRLFLDNHAVKI